ncbi:MAG: hypothetical protein SF187_22120 [Deltaproteobacteria bacterium]|nr:hypothetical protein [Deltaproteobacteria bacterium]
MIHWLIALRLFFIVGATVGAAPTPASQAPFVHPPVLSQALPLKSYDKGFTLCQSSPPQDVNGYFQVSWEQAAKVDQLVLMELRRKVYKGKIKGRPELYARQFLGIHRGDRSVIYVNAVFPPPAGSVDTLAVDCTGAAKYWGIEYDLSFERFANFSVSKTAVLGAQKRNAGK